MDDVADKNHEDKGVRIKGLNGHCLPQHPTKNKDHKEINGVHGTDGGCDGYGHFVVKLETAFVFGVDVLGDVAGFEVIRETFRHWYKYTRYMSKLKLLIFIILILAVGYALWAIYWGKWDGKSRFTVISVINGVVVSSFDPQTGEGIKIIFPVNWEVGGSEGRGKWMADKIGRVGSRKWAADSVSEELGILYTSEWSEVSWGDKIIWWWWGRKIKWREVEAKQWMRKELTVDGVEVWKLDEVWNTAAKELLVSSAVLEERLMVTVVNVTGEPGLAERIARRIETSGLRVVATRTGEEPVNGCQVVSSKTSKSKIGTTLMKEALGCSWKEAEMGENEVELFFGQR